MFRKFSDRNLIEGIRKQDVAVLNWLYDNYFPAVSKYIIQNKGTPDDASDIFQDSIIILYSQIKDQSLNLTSDLKGYFFGIARNCWKEHLRVRKITTVINENLPVYTQPEEIAEHLFERIISRAFRKLDPDKQEILVLFKKEKDFKRIASKLNITEVYARRKKYNAKEDLIKEVKKDPEYQEYLRFLK